MTKPYNGGKPTFNEGQTPIGLVAHLYHDKPQLKTKDQHGKIPDIDPETGFQIAEYKITLAWSKTREAELAEVADMAHRTKLEGWPDSEKPNAFFQLEPFFRDGDNPGHNTKGKDYLRGRYYLNFKQKAKAARDPNTGHVMYSGAPGLLGPLGPEDLIMPADIWPGCTARCSYIMFATEYMGKHFISTRLQNIQKYDEGDGTRIGGGERPTAASQFGALKQGTPGQSGGASMFGSGGGLQPPQQPQNAPSDPFGFGGVQQPNPFGAGGTVSGQQANPFAPVQNPFGAQPVSPSNQFGNTGGRTII